jgi:dolichol kinase
MFSFEIFEIIFIISSIIITFIYLKDKNHEHLIKRIYPLIISMIVTFIITFFANPNLNISLLLLVVFFSLIFSIIPFFYGLNKKILTFLMFFSILSFTYADYLNGLILFYLIIAFSIGTALGVYYRSGLQAFERKHKSTDKALETKRDIVHIFLGTIIITVFFIFTLHTAIYITMSFIFLGYLYNGIVYNSKNKLYTAFINFERDYSLYGLGALYLGVGTALLIGFIHNFHFLIIGFIALFFADPLATIIGINIKSPKLIYNNNKSIIGSFTFFVVVSTLSYYFIGIYALAFGILLAFVESLDLPIDDNITIALAMIILYIVFLASTQQLPLINLI